MLGLIARRRRDKGFYDHRTLALFRRAWVRSRSIPALLAYLLFRRDLGFSLTERWVVPLREALPRLRTRQKWLAYSLLVEIGALPREADVSGDVDTLHAMQADWRASFAQLMRERAAAGICVVGNAAWLNGSGQGSAIDRHGLVVRFNRFRGAASTAADIGSRLDVWVVAPGFDGPPPDARWVVVSGPDMRFRRRTWDSLRPVFDAGAAVLTVPLAPWRALTAQLQAPPSAGVLFLAWLRSMLGSWEGVRAVGFGAPVLPGGTYHHADPCHRAVGRHNWAGERALLAAWEKEGLSIERGA